MAARKITKKHILHTHIPYVLWAALKAKATRNRRSLTAEVVIAIEAHLGSGA